MLGQVEERWQLYVVYAVFALGFAGAGLDPGDDGRHPLVPRPPLGGAVSVASTGLSAGGIVLTPVAKWLIDDRGLAVGDADPRRRLAASAIVPFAIWLVRPDPAALGWHPDGERVRADVAPMRRRSACRSHEAVRSRFFIGDDARPTSLVLGAQVGGIQQLVKLVEDRTDASTAAIATTALAGMSVIARLAGGRIVARLPIVGFVVGAGRRRRRCRWPLIAFADSTRWRSSCRSSCSAPPSATS